MRNSKYFLLALFSLVVLSIAIAALIVWGYFSYMSPSKDLQQSRVMQKSDTPRVSQPMDSYRVIKNETPDVRDSTDQLEKKLAELNQLQTEIQTLIDSKKSKEADSASIQLKQLQQNIQTLESKNRKIAEENKKLIKAVTVLSRKQIPVQSKSNTQKATQDVSSGQVSREVTVSGLTMYALTDENAITTLASATFSFQGTFAVHSGNIKSGYLMVVITNPDGKVLLNAPWESGFFDTPDGKKMYSTRLHFTNSDKQLTFTLKSENLRKGTYTLELYFNGELMASLSKTLG